jgi:C-terminal processing protease CtpA/Prc
MKRSKKSLVVQSPESTVNLSLLVAAICLIVSTLTSISPGQNLSVERSLHRQILKDLRKDLNEHYYDPNLKGVDLETNLKKAEDLIDGAKSVEEMTDIVARVLYPFEDSHLYFLPPARTVTVDYQWTLMPIGEKVFVTALEEDSDAWKKGLRLGDQIYMIDGFVASREHFNLLSYHYEVLAPRPKLQLIIVKPSKNRYQVEIQPKVTRESVFKPTTRELGLELEREFRERTRQGYSEEVPGLSIWKIPSFEFSDIKVGKMIGKINKGNSLILDLRGNSGGLAYSLEELVKVFFEKEVSVGSYISRKGKSQMKFEGSGKDAFSGKLIVLVDSASASAAELFARVVQLEGRGKVVGDRSLGGVMASVTYPHFHGLDNRIGYGFSITVADIVMRDGQRLEKQGVTPDELVMPTPDDIASKRDPVLSRAAQMLGFSLSPGDAGKIFAKK